MTEIPAHPAKFSDVIIERIAAIAREELTEGSIIVDPFAGIGRIHELRPEFETWGVEIEPEWAAASPWTVIGDSRKLLDLIGSEGCDAIITSVVYGNRMSDSHFATDGSKRITYTHKLGRQLTDGNAGKMHFTGAGKRSSARYEELHRQVWSQCRQVLTSGGLLILNISNFIRAGKEVDVTSWHVECLESLGFAELRREQIKTPRMRWGQNADKRVDFESLIVFRAS